MVLDIIIIIIIVAIFLSTIRILIGPTVWDRLLGLSLVSSKIIILIVLYSLKVGQSFYLDIALVFAILGFVGSTSLAQFLKKHK